MCSVYASHYTYWLYISMLKQRSTKGEYGLYICLALPTRETNAVGIEL